DKHNTGPIGLIFHNIQRTPLVSFPGHFDHLVDILIFGLNE
ncbi:unnamed protein product, partial [marine sediment metagenome]